MRFLGTMLLMLLFSLFQLVSAKPASATLTAKESRHFTIDFFSRDSAVSISIRGESDPATNPRYYGVDRMAQARPDAMNKSTYTSVFYRLNPGIVIVPRMNRVPKPKSVYRSFARAPGADFLNFMVAGSIIKLIIREEMSLL